MVWFKVDDRFHGSEPVKRIPREHRAAAIGLWTLAGTWSAQFLKDGFVPGHMVDDLGGSDVLAGCLVDAGLWRARRDGFQFVDWAKWQPTREKVEEKKTAEARRAAQYRARRAAKSEHGHGTVTRDESVSHATVRSSRPVPSRPDPNHDQSQLQLTSEPVESRDRPIHAVENSRRNPTGVDIDHLVPVLQQLTHEPVFPGVAKQVAEHFTAKAGSGGVVHPTRYVLACIDSERPEVEKFLNTGRWSA